MSIFQEDMKLKHLQYGFQKLTEANMFYILGLVEGLRHAQCTVNEKPQVKMLNKSCDNSSVLCNNSAK